MKALLRRFKNVANDRITRVLFYDQTLKKGYASLASFSKLFVLRRILVTLVAYPLSLVCWVFLFLLNLFTPVRIYRFERPQRPGAASVYIAQLEPLCRELQNFGHKGILIFIDVSECTNLALVELYATHFNLYLDDRVAFVRIILALMPKNGFLNTFVKYSTYDDNWELPHARDLRTKRTTSVPKEILKLELEPFKFVLLAHNSQAYLKKYNASHYQELNRFTDLDLAEDAIKEMHEIGLKTVRMGLDTDELPDSLKRLPIIDLSGKFRTDAQDLWLSANCLFLWGINNNGAWHFAHKYDRPTLVTNNYSIPNGYQHTLFTNQMIWDKKKNRFLSISEMASLNGVFGRVSEMSAHGLTYVENSAQELVASVAEMIKYEGNKLEYSQQDISLLSQFNEALKKSGKPTPLKNHSRPCVSFLRANQALFFHPEKL